MKNEEAVESLRQSARTFIRQCRGEGIPDNVIFEDLLAMNLAYAREIGAVRAGEEVPPELYEPLTQFITAMMQEEASGR